MLERFKQQGVLEGNAQLRDCPKELDDLVSSRSLVQVLCDVAHRNLTSMVSMHVLCKGNELQRFRRWGKQSGKQ